MQVTWSDSTSKGKESNHSNESEDNPIFWMHKYEITLILFYVFFFFGYSRENFKIMMINEFEMTDISLISYFLGLEEKQHVKEEEYVKDLLGS